MSEIDTAQDDGGIAAALIAADPAFAALESSGAPIFAMTGDPLRLVHLNASALAVFGPDAEALGARLLHGADPGARRMAEVIESVRHGSAPRLERLRLSFGPIAQTVTILCRRLDAPGGAAVFALAALGVRPAVAAAEAARRAGKTADAQIESEEERIAALRARLTARAKGFSPRFLWKTDADDRFLDASPLLATVAGERCADIIGRTVDEATARFALGDALAQAFASRRSWSGVEIIWPLEDGAAQAPATFGALPTFDDAQRFSGFQGYGVLHLDRATPRGPSAPPLVLAHKPDPITPAAAGETRAGESAAPPSAAPPRAKELPPAHNVVPLRPAPPSAGDAPAALASPPTLVAPTTIAAERVDQARRVLTREEQDAFDDIARTLGVVAAPPSPAARGLMELVERAVATPAPLGAAAAPLPATPLPATPASAGEAAFAAMLDRLPVGVLIVRGAETLYANRTLLDYLGYPDLAALAVDGGPARLFFGKRAEAGAGPLHLRDSNGESLDVDAHLQSVDWAGDAATLVTLRHRHDRAPRAPAPAENDSLRAALDANPDAVALLDAAGRVAHVNAAFSRLTGFDAEALAGRNAASLVIEEDAARLRLPRAGETAGAPDEETPPLLLKTSAGAPRPVDASLEPVAPAGKDAAFCLILRDSAPRLAALSALEEARAQAERASAAKSEFLARVSHEIRTPLNAIIGFAEVMMEERFGPIGSQRYKDYLKDVHASGAHVLSLVNDLLDLSKIEAGKMELNFERVDANAIVAECVSIMQAQANQGRIVIRLSLAPRLPRIRADKRSLRQILLNLLSNAVKFNEAGGQVIVSSALTDAGYVILRVKDTGLGMTDAEVAIALEPFKQLPGPRDVKGTGLGLPVTKALIEANNASFTIRSRKNEGTLVEIAFAPQQVLAAE